MISFIQVKQEQRQRCLLYSYSREDAYGVTEITGGGLENIVKQLGSAGTADPLNQRATTGWKATKTAEILVENYMVRVETASTFESGEN